MLKIFIATKTQEESKEKIHPQSSQKPSLHFAIGALSFLVTWREIFDYSYKDTVENFHAKRQRKYAKAQ
jgi:hypothetical protein